MKCAICDSNDDNITIDPRDGRFRPCFVCQGIIFDAVLTPSDTESEFIVDEDFDNAASP